MYALLLLLGVSFFFIFFLFSRVPGFEGYFIGSLFLEANLYVIFSLLSCFLVYKHSVNNTSSGNQQDDISFISKYIPEGGEIKDFFRDFFSHYIYYIAGVLFYFAIFLISRGFFPELNIAYIFLLFNTIVAALYYFSKKYNLGKDLLIVNLVLISLYYIGVHLLYLFGYSQSFSEMDFINIFTLFIFFSITLFDQEYVFYRKIIEQYFIVFFFLELSSLYKLLFSTDISSLGIIAGFMGAILLIFTDEIRANILISKYTSRTWGLIFSCISVMIFSVLVIIDQQLGVVFSALISFISVLMFLFHRRFMSYFSLSVGTVGITSFSYFLYNILLATNYGNIYLSSVFFFLSIMFIYILRKMQTSYEFDRYFFRIISVLVNLIGVITFLFFNEISILNIGLLLLGESVYLFFIYYSLRKYTP